MAKKKRSRRRSQNWNVPIIPTMVAIEVARELNANAAITNLMEGDIGGAIADIGLAADNTKIARAAVLFGGAAIARRAFGRCQVFNFGKFSMSIF